MPRSTFSCARFAAALALAPALASAPAAHAQQEGPSFDCAAADGMVEEMICKDAVLATLDRRMAERYAAALSVAKGLDAGAAEAEAELRAMQRGWIGGRNECWKAGDPRACVEFAYLSREDVLVATWMLEEPRAVVRYVCEGNPANEFRASFFDTELPALRLEYGDSVEAGWLVRSGSGSRYEMPFGKGLWLKGQEALFTWPEGTEQACVAAG